MLTYWLRKLALLSGAAGLVLSSGCASYVTSRVTAFADWNGSGASETYAFAATPPQRNSIEYTTYEDLVGNELSIYGFTPVPASSAQYLVSLAYGVHNETVMVRSPVIYDPWPGPFRRGFDPWWGPMGPAYVDQPYPIFVHRLTIRMTERASGKEVYKVTATTGAEEPSLLRAMPFLARSALAGFPLQNGTVREVRLPLDGKRGAGNEVAVAPGGASVPAASGAAPR